VADVYEVRKRLLEIDEASIALIAAQPGLGDVWAKRAKVKREDLVRGVPRAVRAIKAATVRDPNHFAADLAGLWEHRIVPQLNALDEHPDPTWLGVRAVTALIDRTGARALLSCLAAAGLAASAEVAERFEELSAACDVPLSEEEMELLTGVAEQLADEHCPHCKSESESVEPPEHLNTVADLSEDVDRNDAEVVVDLDAEAAEDLLRQLRTQAEHLVTTLSAAVEVVRSGRKVPDLLEDINAWDAALSSGWTALGGSDETAPSFELMESLRDRIVERESAAAAEFVREEKLAQLAHLRQTIAGLEPIIASDETFLDAYRLACTKAAALEAELGTPTDRPPTIGETPADAETDITTPREDFPADEPTASMRSADGEPRVETGDDRVEKSSALGAHELVDGEDEGRDALNNPGVLEQDSAPTNEISTTQLPAVDGLISDISTESSGLGTMSPPEHQHQGTEIAADGQEQTRAEVSSGPEAPAWDPCEELTWHISSGRFGAAWLVAEASRLPEHEVRAYRLAAAAFHSAPGGIDPSEVLISMTTALAVSGEFSCQSARLTLAAALRAALAAGWSPKSELEVVATQANLDNAGRDLANAIISASERNYQHLYDLDTDSDISIDDVRRRALTVRTELESLRIKFNRADKVLKYLLRESQPIGAALTAVLEDTVGAERREALASALALLESPEDVIETADAMVSSPQQRRKAIESHARVRLRRALDAAAEVVTDALKATVVVAPDSRIAFAQEIRNSLIAAARGLGAARHPEGPGDAAMQALVQWIAEPDSPQVASELQLLREETLPAVSAQRDSDGLPVVNDACRASVVTELRSPAGWQQLFETYAARGDFQAAEAVGQHAPDLLERLSTARTDWKRRLEREISAARADLAKTYADGATGGPQAVDAQVEAEAQLVAPSEYSGDRFDLQMAELARLRDSLAQHRAKTAEHLRTRATEEIGDPSDTDRIIALIDDEDFVGANELLALARTGTLPPLGLEGTGAGSRMFDIFVDTLSSINVSSPPPVDDLVSIFAGGQLDEDGKRDQVRLRSWGDLVPRRGQNNRDRRGSLFAVLRALGLDTRGDLSRQTSPGVRHFELFRVNATPVDGSLVPGLGSQATHYMVAVTADHKLLRETLSSGFPVKNGPNIVLFDGVLTMDQRRQCLNVCREKKISAIVIDHAVAAFVAARYPRSFRAVQQLTLPFSCFTHYTVVAGNVPDEVFVGRDDELTQLSDRTGSLFVYGGRQLGKSALLRKIQRDFNQVPDQHAIFIDLNSHGIGTWADPQQIWPVLHNELAKIGSFGVKTSSSVRNHEVVTKAIRQWLEGKDSRRLLLLLDEADAFLEKESHGAPAGFRNIGPLKGLFDDTQGRFKPVFAGLHKVQRLQNVANTPLAHGGRDVLIGPLAAKPASDLVVKPLEALGYRFENPEAVWRLLAFTNLQPGLIQVVCNDLVAHLQSRPLRKGEPLIAITETDIDVVTGQETTRSKIAEKLRLTIALEDRYRVIALAVAIMSMEDDFREKYAAEDIRDHCEVYWQQGFDDLNSAEFEVYLDELVGLGVLTRDRESNLFSVRSPNIVTMLGSKDQLEAELNENRAQFELPHEYNPRSTRRQVTVEDRAIRSPLSEHDLSQLVPVQKKYSARDFVIVGGESLGITDVPAVLTQVGSERGAQVTVVDTARADITEFIREFRWVGAGTSSPRVLVVDGTQADSPRAAEMAKATESVQQRGHGHLILVFGRGGTRTVNINRHRWLSSNTRVIALEKWSGDGIRSWHDNPFNTPDHRRDLLQHSGGWPELVERAVVDVSNRSVSYAEEWERLSTFPETAELAAKFLRRVGIEDAELPLLFSWAQLGSTTYEPAEDIAAVLDRDDEEIHSLAETLALTGAINEHQGEFVIDPVVVRALIKLA